jgi:hypothetical protein
MAFYTIEDADFVGDAGPVFDKIRKQGASTGCKVAVTSLSRDSSADPDSGIILWVSMPPDFVVPRHYHDTTRVEIVVKGSLVAGDRILRPGDVMITRPREWYGPYVVGPEGALTAEIGGHFKDFEPVTESGLELIADARGRNEVSERV